MKEATLLLVDDVPENLHILRESLKDLYHIKVATQGTKALALAKAEPRPDLILLDIMMPDMDGIAVCQALKADPLTHRVPVIFVTAMGEVEDEARGLSVGAVDYITKPISPAIVRARVATHLRLYQQEKNLEALVRERTRELEETREAIIVRLGRAAEYKDNETGMHVQRMSHYAYELARVLGMPEDWAVLLRMAAPMHDVGKIGIPDAILQKPGKLDDSEWLVMRTHPAIGAEILKDDTSPLMTMACKIALTHHEKFDGSGYPNRLKGEQIPLEGRIVAVADVFDALTSERPYKKAWSIEEAMALLKEEAGRHFDPQVVAAFDQVVDKVPQIRAAFADAQEKA
ncbi:HD-GYP domain-containing protein [Gallaecimonas pentaromativorans]|uniref:Response regulator receiver modulated metal dependent phosphohydrolase n=1 Tax=Gallaecimonas pentaromativorans TaxID=584787 RepID=A0A3N1PML1_9GAMM|nr:two-component system response regulator [Gallaecimonas pentaromativorans]ROQ29823.1 response regulator receiver modulated metal dependent phosphohydrolase [Gallaecimonas pentaromativorans]